MISATTFARQSSVWNEAAPTLEQVVRWANEHQSSTGRAVPTAAPAERHSLIAETAFNLAKLDADAGSSDEASAEHEARTFIQGLPRAAGAHDPLSTVEWHEAIALKEGIESYTHWLPDVQFRVPVPGCGVVDSSFADITARNELIEVKAVGRQFRGSDFRQLLTYATMFYASGRTFERLTVLNPRKGNVVSMPINRASINSSGKTAVELLQELVVWMTGLQISA